MYLDTDFPPGGVRLAQFMRVASDFDRNEIEAAVDGFIAMLDARDGDADVEDATGLEDAFETHLADGPGCAIADTGEHVGDERDASFPEWRPYGRAFPTFSRGMKEALQHEDAEDGDSDRCVAGDDHMISGPVAQLEWFRSRDIGDDVDAEPAGDEMDHNSAEDDWVGHLGSGPGCPVSDPGGTDGADQ